MLLATVVGSGIMGDRLSGGNVVIALLENALATGAALVALILTFGRISGAHLNPAVSVVDCSQGGLPRRDLAPYIVVQVVAAVAGVLLANTMFGEPTVAWSEHPRHGSLQLLSEFVATFGLVAVIWGTVKSRPAAVPFAVGAYITAAYWFTPSTSFANPAVTIARAFTNTFAGIRPVDVPAFIAVQLAGAVVATLVFRWLTPPLSAGADRVLAPHDQGVPP
jgi:glycerol uptake facilitator-like aquaporin